MPVADVLGPAPAEVGVLLEAAAGAEVADPPEVPLLLELLPQAASKTRPAAAPGAAHHRLRISLSPFDRAVSSGPHHLQHVCRAAIVHARFTAPSAGRARPGTSGSGSRWPRGSPRTARRRPRR